MWLRLRNVQKKKKKKDACPFLFLENFRSLSLLWEPQTPFSSSGTPDFLSTCLGIDSLTPSPFTFHLSQHHFLMSQLFMSGGQSMGASASASVLPMNIQGLFPLELTGLISLLPKGLSNIFSSTTVQKNQLFDTQPSLWSNSHIHTGPMEKP